MCPQGKKPFLRRLLAAILIVPLVVPSAPAAKAAGSLELASEAAVLIDADTGLVLYEKNMNRQMYPASITKVMTGMLALKYLNPEEMLTVSNAAVNAVPSTSSHISLEPGEELTFEQTMLALSMQSANDAANVLAEAVSGSLEAFGQLMTQEAHALGAVNTNFVNANGLPNSEHYTTAYDMALITAAALKMPGFTEYFSRKSYVYPATNVCHYVRNFTNKNQILNGPYSYEGVLMSKTGWTTAAQGTLVTAAKRGDTTLVAVVMKSIMLEDKYRDTVKLFDYGFTNYALAEVSGETIAAQLPKEDFEALRSQKFQYLINANIDPAAITYTLAEGMTLDSSAADQTAVVVHAALEDTPLKDITLIMVRPGTKAAEEAELALAAMEIAEETEPEAPPKNNGEPEITPAQWAIGIGLLVLYISLRVYFVRRRERKHRKRRLEGRMRMMRKMMEED